MQEVCVSDTMVPQFTHFITLDVDANIYCCWVEFEPLLLLLLPPEFFCLLLVPALDEEVLLLIITVA